MIHFPVFSLFAYIFVWALVIVDGKWEHRRGARLHGCNLEVYHGTE